MFDTSLIVDASRKKKYALDLIESYSGKEQVATTIITKYEMLRGAPKQYIDFVVSLLDRFVILDFEGKAVEEAVKVYKSLSNKGKMINELDIIILGIVMANNQTIITKDKDFINYENNKVTVLSQK